MSAFWATGNWHYGPPRPWVTAGPGLTPSGIFTIHNQELSSAQVLGKIRELEKRVKELESQQPS